MHINSWQRRWECAPAAARVLAYAASLWLVAGALLITPGKSAAQQFSTRHYRRTEGLENLVVTCLLQDRDGFIWACTENGLFRLDGSRFERIGNSEGIDSLAIRSAIEDYSGTLWVGTSHELYRRDEHGFHAIRPEGRRLAIAAGMQIAALASGHLLVIDADQLLELSAAADGIWHSRPFFTQEQLGATPALEHLGSLSVDQQGQIWLGCGASICRAAHGRVERFDADVGVPEDQWRSWLFDREGRLWVRGLVHVAVLEPTATRFETRDPPHGRRVDESLNVPLVEDLEGRILVSGTGGLSRWHAGAWQDFTKANGIPDGGISALLVSRDGQVWLGLHGGGMLRWPGYGHFESWTMAQGLGDFHVQSIVNEADSSVLLATLAGCYRLEVAATMAAPCRFGGLPRGAIQVMTRGGGALWIGMAAGGLFRIGAGDQHATWVADLASMRTLYVDSAGRLWIGTDDGVDVLETGAGRVEIMPLPTPAGKVTDVTEDAEGAIWLATQGGLLRWSGGRWIVLGIDGEDARAGFASVAADRAGWLWAGGAALGMLHLHVEGDSVDAAQWVPDFMLARAAVRFTRIDPHGRVWAGTDSGVVVFDGQLWRRFNSEDGLISNSVLENGFFADTDGSLWIGTRGGATHITKPEALLRSRPIGLRISRSNLGAQELDAASTRRPWEPNMALNLHLAELNYGSVGRSYLRVRLRGLADQWFETRNHDLQYPRLAPGRYTFEAVAFDPDHRQTSQLTQLSFEILPPWWRTSWFQLAAAAALVAMLGCAWNWRARKLRAQQRELERQKREHKALLIRATRDALTGLWNRATILEILAREVKSARQRAMPLAVAIIDIDHFKRINDTRGHLAGDEVLRTLGAKLMSRVRATDSLGRYGGEEFLLVVPGAPTQTPFLPLERLQRAVAEIPFSYSGSDIKVTASFGVAWLNAESDTTELLLGRADAALYSAKHAGRNRVEYAATG